MNDPFEKLSAEEKKLVYQAPAMVSVLASCQGEKILPARKLDALKLAHMKSFTADPSLLFYYKKVEDSFENDFNEIAHKYEPFSTEKRHLLKNQVEKISHLIKKLDPAFGTLFARSLRKYADHVRKADHSVFQDFIFPVPIPGLSV
jgi:hypothetical protein